MKQITEKEYLLSTKVLLEAAYLISIGWTQGCMARNAIQGRVACTDISAIAWDVQGAINKAIEGIHSHLFNSTRDNVFNACIDRMVRVISGRIKYSIINELFAMLTAFNDDPDRKDTEVVDMLLVAAKSQFQKDFYSIRSIAEKAYERVWLEHDQP